jgi:clan AA aspartic protease (TIGR02281 family)
MKTRVITTSVLAAGLLCGLGSAAHATLICGASHQLVGKTGTNPVISTTVARDGLMWRVVHTLRNGQIIDRGVQYNMTDDSADYTSWSGRLNRNPSLWMHGELVPQADGRTIYYNETLHDDKTGDVVMASETACVRENLAPTYEPPVVAQAPTYTPAPAPSQGGDSMPITVIGTHAAAPVVLGSMPVTMMIDTGCTDLSITQTIADRLVSSGQATYDEDVEYTMADGSTHTNKTISIATVTIGGHVLHNVHAGIDPDGAPLLLGFTILQQISPKFSIDTAAGVLTFG